MLYATFTIKKIKVQWSDSNMDDASLISIECHIKTTSISNFRVVYEYDNKFTNISLINIVFFTTLVINNEK